MGATDVLTRTLPAKTLQLTPAENQLLVWVPHPLAVGGTSA